MAKAVGLVLVANNDDIDAMHRPYEPEERAIDDDLTAYLRRRWQQAHTAKQPHERRMLRNLRQRNGEYDPDKLSAIREEGRSEIYMMLTAVKCRAAKSWIRDVLMPAGDRPFELKATKTPELPPEVAQQLFNRLQHDAAEWMQVTGEPVTPQQWQDVQDRAQSELQGMLREQAKDRAHRMADMIEEQLHLGGWQRQFDLAISDLVDFPAAIIKGPVLRRRKQLVYPEGGGAPTVVDDIVPETERVSPFDFYPLPGVEEPDDGDVIQRHRLSRSDLYDMIGVPGYDESAIRRVLEEHATGGLSEWLTQTFDSAQDRANDDQKAIHSQSNLIDALEFWVSVPGSLLIEWGMDPFEVPDPEQEYAINAWLVGGDLIKVQINPDPMGRKPYSKASFEDVPGSFWGRGVPDLMRDCQLVCNAAARALVDNMGIASGPQVVMNTGAMAAGEQITKLYPWRIWQFDFAKDPAGSRMPMQFFQPNPMTDALLKVYDRFSREADEQSGIPAYTYGGSNVGGAGRTASGMSMLMNAASKGIKNVIAHIDAGIITTLVRRYWEHNMQFHPDASIKGDVEVVARGALALVQKEQVQMRRIEYLQLTANPLDAKILGVPGRANIHRELLRSMDIDPDTIPDDDELRKALAAEQMQQQATAVDPRELGPDGQPLGDRGAGVV